MFTITRDNQASVLLYHESLPEICRNLYTKTAKNFLTLDGYERYKKLKELMVGLILKLPSENKDCVMDAVNTKDSSADRLYKELMDESLSEHHDTRSVNKLLQKFIASLVSASIEEGVTMTARSSL